LYLTTLLGSCKPDETIDVNQDKVYTEFELFYNHVENRTYANAKFRHKKAKGTILKLSSSSSVTFASQPLYYNASLQQYEVIFDSLISSGEFVWTDTEGRIFRNSISLAEINLEDELVLIQNQNNTVPWQGKSIGADEYVILFLYTSGNNAEYVINKSPGANTIIVGPDNLNRLPKGQLTASIERNSMFELTEATDAGGTMKGRYRSAEVVVNVQ